MSQGSCQLRRTENPHADQQRPQLVAQPDVADNHLESHNAWVVSSAQNIFYPRLRLTLVQIDNVVDYVDWAVSKGFGVMDVNVPAALPHEEV